LTGLILLRIGKRDGRLSTGGSCKTHGISLLADELSAFQIDLCHLELAGYLFICLFSNYTEIKTCLLTTCTSICRSLSDIVAADNWRCQNKLDVRV